MALRKYIKDKGGKCKLFMSPGWCVAGYSELTVVDLADVWRERNVWYPGRSRQRMKTEYEIRE